MMWIMPRSLIFRFLPSFGGWAPPVNHNWVEAMTEAMRMDGLIRRVLRQELGLGFQPAYRIPLDVEGGVAESGHRYCWGVFDHDRQVFVPEMMDSIVGYFQGFGVKEGREYKGKIPRKLVIHLDCGARGSYAIKAGLETAFSKGLLNAIASLTAEQAKEAVKIVVRPGNDESGKVVLPSLYVGSQWVKPQHEYPVDVGQLRTVFRAAAEVIPQIEFKNYAEQQAA